MNAQKRLSPVRTLAPMLSVRPCSSVRLRQQRQERERAQRQIAHAGRQQREPDRAELARKKALSSDDSQIDRIQQEVKIAIHRHTQQQGGEDAERHKKDRGGQHQLAKTQPVEAKGAVQQLAKPQGA